MQRNLRISSPYGAKGTKIFAANHCAQPGLHLQARGDADLPRLPKMLAHLPAGYQRLFGGRVMALPPSDSPVGVSTASALRPITSGRPHLIATGLAASAYQAAIWAWRSEIILVSMAFSVAPTVCRMFSSNSSRVSAASSRLDNISATTVAARPIAPPIGIAVAKPVTTPRAPRPIA